MPFTYLDEQKKESPGFTYLDDPQQKSKLLGGDNAEIKPVEPFGIKDVFPSASAELEKKSNPNPVLATLGMLGPTGHASQVAMKGIQDIAGIPADAVVAGLESVRTGRSPLDTFAAERRGGGDISADAPHPLIKEGVKAAIPFPVVAPKAEEAANVVSEAAALRAAEKKAALPSEDVMREAKKVAKMRKPSQDEYFTKEKRLLADRTSAEKATISKKVDDLKIAMTNTGHETTLKVRESFGPVASSKSKEYRTLVENGLKGSEGVSITRAEVSDKLSKVMPNNLEEQVNILNRIFPENTDSVGAVAANQHIESFSKDISQAGKEGTRNYTWKDKKADDARTILVDLLEEKGVTGIREAKQMWAEWAPVRNKAVKTFRVFQQQPIETEKGGKFLIALAQKNDPGNANFMRQLENLTGNDLTGDMKKLVSGLDSAKKEQLATAVRKELGTRQLEDIKIHADKIRDNMWKRILTRLGWVGASAATGYEVRSLIRGGN